MTTESPPAPALHRPVGGAALQCTACHRIIGLGESLEALQYGADTCCEDEQLRSPDDCPGLLRLVAVAVTDLPHPVGVDQQPPGTDGWPLWALQALAGYDQELARLVAAGAPEQGLREWRGKRAELVAAMAFVGQSR
jgi:hypothetical protein